MSAHNRIVAQRLAPVVTRFDDADEAVFSDRLAQLYGRVCNEEFSTRDQAVTLPLRGQIEFHRRGRG